MIECPCSIKAPRILILYMEKANLGHRACEKKKTSGTRIAPFFDNDPYMHQVDYMVRSCQTRRRSRGVCVAFLNFLYFSRTPRELQEKMILFVKKASHGVLIASSRRPRRVQCVPTEFSLRSAEFYVAFHGACKTFSLRCAALLAFAPRFHDVRTALPRRSSTGLTACRQNRNKVSLLRTFAFKKTA